MKVKASLWAAAALAIGAAIPALALAQQTYHATLGAAQVYIQTSSQRTSYTIDSVTPVAWIDDINIPAGSGGILVATFSAESECVSGNGSVAHCKVQIFCGGQEMFPRDVAGDFSFNSSRSGVSNVSITRHSESLGLGNYACGVAASAPDGATHHLDDWSFTVKFWRSAT